jgi:hypothetical protein
VLTVRPADVGNDGVDADECNDTLLLLVPVAVGVPTPTTGPPLPLLLLLLPDDDARVAMLDSAGDDDIRRECVGGNAEPGTATGGILTRDGGDEHGGSNATGNGNGNGDIEFGDDKNDAAGFGDDSANKDVRIRIKESTPNKSP